MRRSTASRFPNGRRKSELYELFLTHRDFRCTLNDFAQDLEDIILEERLGKPNCEWYKDSDGERVVAGLELRDTSARIVITHDGFVIKLRDGITPSVFVSYAREDVGAAQRLADALAQTGLPPWIDRDQLLGGHRWKTTIENAILNSEFFVALLSSRSVDKRGFVQREFRRAIEVAQNVPEGRVFIVPVRLEPVDPGHDGLRELHCVDLFPEWDTGVKRLVNSLHSERHARADRRDR